LKDINIIVAAVELVVVVVVVVVAVVKFLYVLHHPLNIAEILLNER
jgi:hypothetical protein